MGKIPAIITISILLTTGSILYADITYAETTKSCDVNKDGIVDEIDINEITRNYNITSKNSKWNSNYDINSDGIIDIYDMVIVSKSLGTSTIENIEDITMKMYKGDSLVLPKEVSANLKNGDNIKVPILWESSSIDTSKIGKLQVIGNVKGYEKNIILILNIVEAFKVYQNDKLLNTYELQQEAVEYAKSNHHSKVVDSDNKIIWDSVKNYNIYSNDSMYIKAIDDLNLAISEASKITNAEVIDVNGNVVWNNNTSHYSIVKFDSPTSLIGSAVIDKGIKEFNNLYSTIKIAANYKNSIVYNEKGIRLWDNFGKKYFIYDNNDNNVQLDNDTNITNLTEVIKKAALYENSKVYNEQGTCVWENIQSKYMVYQNDNILSTYYNIKEFEDLQEIIAYASDYSNSKIFNDKGQCVWDNSEEKFYVYQNINVLKTYEAIEGAISCAQSVKDSKIIDSSGQVIYDKVKISYGYVTATSLNVRTGPSTSYAKTGQPLQHNERVPIIKKDGWYQIVHNNALAYVSDSYITFDEPFYTEYDGRGVVTASSLNLRGHADSSKQNIIVAMPKETIVNIKEQVIDSDKDIWYRVSCKVGEAEYFGYAHSAYVDVFDDLANEALLGEVSAKYESNGDPGRVANNSWDYGGKSYGAWQLASKMGSVDRFLSWLKNQNSYYYDILIEAYENDGQVFGDEFDRVWRAIATDNYIEFLNLQHAFIKYSYFDGPVYRLLRDYNFDMSKKSYALKNVLWSTSVQHGQSGAARIFSRVGFDHTDDEMIKLIYDERSKMDVYFSRYVGNDNVTAGLLSRFKNEKADALKIYNYEINNQIDK